MSPGSADASRLSPLSDGDAGRDPSPGRLARQARPKILLYSHDTFGLGNIRRSLLLGDLLSTEYPAGAVLLLTGSPMIHAFRIPDRMDYVKLPCVDRISADRYAPRFLTACADEVRQTRADILERTAVAFRPDLVIVDKRAGGIDGELLPALQALRGLPAPPAIVLGLRDILDAPSVTRGALRANGSFDAIERFYDEVWIYGSQSVFDAVAEYDFPAAVAQRTRYCGYLRRRQVARRPAANVPRILVTTGGGADGASVIHAYLDALASVPAGTMESVIVLGPQLDAETSQQFQARAAAFPGVNCLEFEPELARHYAWADVVISMAGYNTVCELLTAGVRAVLVPRAEPVQEQLIRARSLSARGHFRMVEPSELTADRLMSALREALADAPASGRAAIDMEGLTRIRARVQRLLEGRAQ